MKLSTLNVAVPPAKDEITEYNINITIEASHAPPISVKCCLIEENDDLSMPKKSLVVAVEPTIDPTAPQC
jgi:hypothetical protein